MYEMGACGQVVEMGLSKLLACPTEFRLASLYNCVSQFLKVNFSLYILLVLFLRSTLTSTTIIPIFQMGKPRHREFKQLA